ncbi:MAG: DUF370 domain-containing protein [Oscillospiraceae bacterium]|nr:DUF370 domain-containing protein [Oscillospiraceae bacterium]
MFVQAAKDRYIMQREIVGVFDLDTSTISGVTKNFLSKAEKDGKTAGIDSLPKSFVLRANRFAQTIYFSANMTGHIKNGVYPQAGPKGCGKTEI